MLEITYRKKVAHKGHFGKGMNHKGHEGAQRKYSINFRFPWCPFVSFVVYEFARPLPFIDFPRSLCENPRKRPLLRGQTADAALLASPLSGNF